MGRRGCRDLGGWGEGFGTFFLDDDYGDGEGGGGDEEEGQVLLGLCRHCCCCCRRRAPWVYPALDASVYGEEEEYEAGNGVSRNDVS